MRTLHTGLVVLIMIYCYLTVALAKDIGVYYPHTCRIADINIQYQGAF